MSTAVLPPLPATDADAPEWRVEPGLLDYDRAVAFMEARAEAIHAGTARDGDGRLRATGGRVLGVTALGADAAEARARAYAAVDRIDWPEGFCRRDIGWRAVGRAGG